MYTSETSRRMTALIEEMRQLNRSRGGNTGWRSTTRNKKKKICPGDKREFFTSSE